MYTLHLARYLPRKGEWKQAFSVASAWLHRECVAASCKQRTIWRVLCTEIHVPTPARFAPLASSCRNCMQSQLLSQKVPRFRVLTLRTKARQLTERDAFQAKAHCTRGHGSCVAPNCSSQRNTFTLRVVVSSLTFVETCAMLQFQVLFFLSYSSNTCLHDCSAIELSKLTVL